MKTIKIQAEGELVAALEQIAKSKLTTVEALAKEALLNYLQLQSSQLKSNSSINQNDKVLSQLETEKDPLDATFGGWKELVDCEELKKNIYAERQISSRPEVKL